MIRVHGLPPTSYMSLGKSVYLLNGCCEDQMNYYMSLLQMVTAAMKLKDAYSLEDDQPRQHIKKQRHYIANKGPSSQGYGFSSGHVWM